MSGPNRAAEAISLDMASTNVSHTGYTTVKAALAQSCAYVEVINPSATPIQLAVGGAGGEADVPMICPQNTGARGLVPLKLDAGQRLSAKALGGADINAGTLIINTFA